MDLPIELTPLRIPSALVGQLVVFGAFALIAWALLREAARVVIRVLLVGGILLAAAIWLGLLNESAVVGMLERIGDGLIVGIRATTQWLARAWEQTAGP